MFKLGVGLGRYGKDKLEGRYTYRCYTDPDGVVWWAGEALPEGWHYTTVDEFNALPYAFKIAQTFTRIHGGTRDGVEQDIVRVQAQRHYFAIYFLVKRLSDRAWKKRYGEE